MLSMKSVLNDAITDTLRCLHTWHCLHCLPYTHTYTNKQQINKGLKMTIAQYITANSLDLRPHELEKLAINSLAKTPHTYKYSEHDLDELAAKHHFSCFLPTKRTQEYGYIYILKAYMDDKPLNICKVGTTIKSPHDRCKTLNKTWFKCGVTFEVHKISKEIPHAVDVEGCIHQVLKAKGLHYIPKCKANGRTELFTYEEWIDNLLPI